MRFPAVLAVLAALSVFGQEVAMPISLTLVPATAHQAEVRVIEPGTYEIRSTGGDQIGRASCRERV